MIKIREGTKVKCIDDHFIDQKTNPFDTKELNLPKKDEIYTIRSITKTLYGKGLKLKEIKNKKYYFEDIGKYKEPIFRKERFEILE